MEVARTEPTQGHTPSARSPLLDILLKENQRSMAVLSRQEKAPAYFLSYQIYDRRSVVLETEGGALVTDSDDAERWLDVEVRVGSPRLDNRHPLSDEQQNAINSPRVRRGVVPFGTDEQAIRNHLWLETDRRYREAKLALGVVQLDRSVTAQGDGAPDFVHERAEEFIEPTEPLEFDKNEWITRLRACSQKAFRGVATRATCRADFQLDTVYYVNSEGTVMQRSWPTAHLMVSVGVKADDGMPLNRLEQRFGRCRGAAARRGARSDHRYRHPRSRRPARGARGRSLRGPGDPPGRAAAVFFHEVFGHRIEGHRQKERTSGQTFASKVGERIMPEWLTVYDDPSLTTLNGMKLNGFYRFDDEGVRAQRALLVEKGVLKGFIMGRNPIQNFANSNGHGRKEPGRSPVSRQGNLVVEAARSLPRKSSSKR